MQNEMRRTVFPYRESPNRCILIYSEITPERGHPARLSHGNSTHAAGRMPALQDIRWFLGVRRLTNMSDCFINL